MNYVVITSTGIGDDERGWREDLEQNAETWLKRLYAEEMKDYPKWHKMSGICKLSTLMAALLCKDARQLGEESGILLTSASSSVAVDREFWESMRQGEEFYPSPSLFVYTLSNIAAGEIAIRHKIYGQISSYIEEGFEIDRMVEHILRNRRMQPSETLLVVHADYWDKASFSGAAICIEPHMQVEDIRGILQLIEQKLKQ